MAELRKAELDRLAGHAPVGSLIEGDRPCADCGYNLKGLRVGGTCPECGTPITAKRRRGRMQADMGESSPRYLMQMSLGMTLVGLGGFGWIFWLVMGPLLRLLAGIVIPFPWMVILLLGMAWAGGNLLILRERPVAKGRRAERGGLPEWWLLRLTVAATQGFALLASASFLLLVVTGWAGWAVALLLSLAVMFAGWAPLCLYLSRIAYWAGDDDLGARFHALSYWVAVLGLLSALLFGPDVGVFAALKWVGAMSLVFFLVLSVMVMMAIMRMASTVRWAERHAVDARARDRRMAAKAREEAERSARERADALATGAGGTVMTSEQERMLAEIERKAREAEARGAAGDGSHEPTLPPGQQHVVKSGDNVEVFDLEDEDRRGGRGLAGR